MSFAIPLAVPHLMGNEKLYIDECLRSNYVSSVGPFVERFEGDFAAYLGVRHAVACVSGTAALHLSMRLLGIGAGDEVFAPSFTFVASLNPILYERATPVLVDSEPRTWNMDPERAITEISRRARLGLKQPKAVMVVHILGHPAEIEPVLEVCQQHGIHVVEDAAEALGARYRAGRFAERHVGTLGVMGCFSFNGNKILTTGGGGILVTDDEGLARRARHLVRQARLAGPEYIHDEIGYNYRLTNLAAALGVAQLEQLPGFLARKRALADAYDTAFRGVPGVTLPPRAEWAEPSLWMYSVLLDPDRFGADPRQVREDLAGQGIESRSLWCPAHLMPPYRDLPRLGGEGAEALYRQGLSLPCSVGLGPEDQARVAQAFLGDRRIP